MSGTLYSALPVASSVLGTDTLLISRPSDTLAPFKTATPAQVGAAGFTRAAVAAAGATQGTAAALTARMCTVSASGAGMGVALDSATEGPDGVQVVVNVSAFAVVVYPVTGTGTINGGGAGVGVLVAVGGMVMFIDQGGDAWLAR